jgi:hypothetical protein
MVNKKNTHGGARKGAGRKPVDGPTRTLTFRIPIADLDALDNAGVINLSRFYIEAGKKAIMRLNKKSP